MKTIGFTKSKSLHFYLESRHHGLPFELKLPSEETLEAIQELESGKGSTHANFKNLMSSI